MPSLGLAMIVKNSAETLANCVASVAGVVDQVVIADTGSSDGTAQLARDLGAQVFDFPWQDDFSKARNAALAALTTDWALVMDDDEELDPEAREKIPSLLDASTGAYFVTLRNYIPVKFGSGGYAPSAQPIRSAVARAERARAYTDFELCRLFRRHPGIYYVGRVHEHVEPQIQALGLTMARAHVVIHHFGHLASPRELRAKDEFYRELGRLKIQDTPADPQAWIELGLQEYEQFRNYPAGIECFKQALALNPKHSPVPYLSLANLYVEIKAETCALELLAGVTLKNRAGAEKENICGDALYNLGRFKEARAVYLRALRVLSEDARIVSKLGLTEIRLGLKKNGLARVTRALEANPRDLEIQDRMVKACLLMNLMPQAADAAERLAIQVPSPAAILRAASIRAHMKEWKAAEDVIIRGLELFPGHEELLQIEAELRQHLDQAN